MARLKWLNCLMAWLKTGSWFQSFLPSLGNEKNRKLAIFWMNRKDSQKGLKGLPDLTYFTQNGDLGIAWDMFRIFANYEVVLVVSPLEKIVPWGLCCRKTHPDTGTDYQNDRNVMVWALNFWLLPSLTQWFLSWPTTRLGHEYWWCISCSQNEQWSGRWLWS